MDRLWCCWIQSGCRNTATSCENCCGAIVRLMYTATCDCKGEETKFMAPTLKALVLSGGGGRGAYHVGVIEELVRQGWIADGQGPDIIAGTSIGAINAAALASGLTIAQLKDHWLAMHTEEVHRLSSDLPVAARP